MINIKEAIQRSRDYARSVLEHEPKDILLEEVRSFDTYWDITLSFEARLPSARSRIAEAMGQNGEREYKTFRVDKVTGDVSSMFTPQTI